MACRTVHSEPKQKLWASENEDGAGNKLIAWLTLVLLKARQRCRSPELEKHARRGVVDAFIKSS